MRENENIRICGCKTILTPYEAFHVLKYHKWMESESLREETASERLTLEQEYEMQTRWRADPDKCTFIILDKAIFDAHKPEGDKTREDQETDAMVGDVNIFYYDQNSQRKTGEIEIMIAEPHARRRGMGREAVCSMMRYGQSELKTEEFICKIGMKNTSSINLFQSLGFKELPVEFFTGNLQQWQENNFKSFTFEMTNRRKKTGVLLRDFPRNYAVFRCQRF